MNEKYDAAYTDLVLAHRKREIAEHLYEKALVDAYLAGVSARDLGRAVGRPTGFSTVWLRAKKLAGG